MKPRDVAMTEDEELRTSLFVDLFSGGGGLTLGLEAAGFRPLLAVDHAKYAYETLRRNRPQVSVTRLDLAHDASGDTVLSMLHRGELDLIAGGPPCQGFSQIGTRLGTHKAYGRLVDDPRNYLYKNFVRVVAELQPRFVLMENVPGFLSYRDGKMVEAVRQDFRDAGYEVDVMPVDAADFGVPQHRRRAMFVGNRLGLANPRPVPTHCDPEDSEARTKGRLPWVTVWEAIGDLPALKAGNGVDDSEQSTDEPSSHFQASMAPTDGLWRSLILPDQHLNRLWNHRARPHNQVDLARYRALKPGQTARDLPPGLRPGRMHIFDDKYRRQPVDRPSTTVIAHLGKDGHGFIHPTQTRSLTVREAARLQSFPDWYRFYGPRTSQFVQVGNAVPPLLARALGLAIRRALSGDDYSGIPKQPNLVPSSAR